MLSMKRIKLANQMNYVACGFTDGTIRIYRVTTSELILCHETRQAHGFGVNCLDTVVLDATEGKFLVVSGGDDQYICSQ